MTDAMRLHVNGQERSVTLDGPVTLLDALQPGCGRGMHDPRRRPTSALVPDARGVVRGRGGDHDRGHVAPIRTSSRRFASSPQRSQKAPQGYLDTPSARGKEKSVARDRLRPSLRGRRPLTELLE
jgi:hypothetical protein